MSESDMEFVAGKHTRLAEAITEHWGERCADFNPECFCCQAWQEYDRLEQLEAALGALGVIGSGYCFCSHDRDPQKATHQPECRDARAALGEKP